MTRYFFIISYIGTKYRGTQKTPDFPNETVQGALESGLQWLKPANEPLTSFASRTDKGVHALMNTFHVDLEHPRKGEVYPSSVVKKVLNTYLLENKHEILVHNCSVVHPNFHARHLVNWRSYRYRLAVLNPETRLSFSNLRQQIGKHNLCEQFLPISEVNRCHVVPCDLDINVVRDIGNLFRGSHDFATFSKNTIRDSWKCTKRVLDEFKFYPVPSPNCLDIPYYSNVSFWEFYIKSTSFLYHQIRKMVGSALSAGFGILTLEDVKSMLEKPSPFNWVKSEMAPPGGLYLSHLEYGKEGFIENKLCSPVVNNDQNE